MSKQRPGWKLIAKRIPKSQPSSNRLRERKSTSSSHCHPIYSLRALKETEILSCQKEQEIREKPFHKKPCLPDKNKGVSQNHAVLARSKKANLSLTKGSFFQIRLSKVKKTMQSSWNLKEAFSRNQISHDPSRWNREIGKGILRKKSWTHECTEKGRCDKKKEAESFRNEGNLLSHVWFFQQILIQVE